MATNTSFSNTPGLGQPLIGLKATSPQNNIQTPTNTLPASQTAPNYSNYVNKNGTIYNTKGPTSNTTAEGGYATPDALAADLGISKSAIDWSKISSNPNYASSFGQPTPAPTPTPTPTPQPTPTPTPTSNTSSATSTAPYSPPNGGTTGVSSGGVIGNLINTANGNDPFSQQINGYAGQVKDLQNNETNDLASLAGNGTDLGLATGQGAVVQNKYTGRINAINGLIGLLLNERDQNIGATNSAGELNAPIVTQPGAAIVNPSSNTTVGGTTSGAANISSLIGQRPSPSNPSVTEFYNTQTGQGFSSPQQLVDFVNQQQPGAGATASNVFDLLKSGALNSGGGNIVGGNSGLNPISQVNSIAQQVINGTLSPSAAMSMGGTIANWSTLLNQALTQANGGQPIDISTLQAKYDSNQTTQTNQANQIATWKSSAQQASNLGSQLNNLLSTYNLNPNSLNIGNQILQFVGNQTSDPRYIALQNLVTDLANTYANVLTPPGGSVTDMVRSISSGLLGSDNSGRTLSQVIQTLDSQVQAKIAGVSTPSTTGGNNTGSVNNGTTAAGGSLVFQNGQWVVK